MGVVQFKMGIVQLKMKGTIPILNWTTPIFNWKRYRRSYGSLLVVLKKGLSFDSSDEREKKNVHLYLSVSS